MCLLRCDALSIACWLVPHRVAQFRGKIRGKAGNCEPDQESQIRARSEREAEVEPLDRSLNDGRRGPLGELPDLLVAVAVGGAL